MLFPSHDKWEDFITGGRDGLDATVLPTVTLPSVAVGSLADYLGIPTTASPVTVSAFPFRAYAEIFNNYYRDNDLTTPLGISYASGADVTTSTTLQNACWEKDYFTSCRASPQKGTVVNIPLGTTAPVKTVAVPGQHIGIAGPSGNINLYSSGTNSSSRLLTGSGTPDAIMFADLSSATGININDLRLVVALQRFKENMSRFGSRYQERLQAAFGARNLDARLQNPEYLGGGTQSLQFSEVLQTAEGTNPTGTLRGHGIGAMRSTFYRDWETDRKSTRLNSSHSAKSRMPSSA